MNQKLYGPDKLHGSRLADLPPIAQRWKRLHHELRNLRYKMRHTPASHHRWKSWYDRAATLLEQRQHLIPQMHAAGFRVHNHPGGTPVESFRTLQQREILEAIPREQRRATGSIEGWEAWEAFDDDTEALPRVKQHQPTSASSPSLINDEIATTFLSSIHATSSQPQT